MASENRFLTQNRNTAVEKPLGRLQVYLIELKVCVGLIRELPHCPQ
jgi:hypothetical protein